MTETAHCGTRGPADDQRLSALDRSPTFLPDRKERVARAHLAQEQTLIAGLLHRRAADSHGVGNERRPLKLNADKENRRTLPTLQQLLRRLARPNRDQVIPTGTGVGCERLVVGAA